MSQISYSDTMLAGVAGQIGSSVPRTVKSYNNPDEIIYHGRAAAKISGDDDGCELPNGSGADIIGVSLRDLGNIDGYYETKSSVALMKDGEVYVEVEEDVTPDDDVYVRHTGKAQVQTFVLDADLVSSNVITVDVNGETLSTTFATNHLTTISALATLIQAQPDVATAVVGGSGNRTITITAETDKEIELENEEVTLGASQAGITITETTAMILTTDRGKFRTDSDSSTALQITNARFLSSASAGGVALLSIKLP